MEETVQKLTLPALFENTLRRWGKSKAYAFTGEEAVTWEDAWKTIKALISFLEKAGIRPGDLVLTVAFGAGMSWGGNLIRA